MQILQRTAAVLIWPAIACLSVACDGDDAPTETAAPVPAPTLSSGESEGGGKFLLGGTAQLDEDPENPANDVIRIRTDVPPFFGTVSRTVNVKIDKLDNMLEFKMWFEGGYDIPGAPLKTCVGGSPRFELAIDTDGDGESDGNVFLDTGVNGSGTGCPIETWLYEDFTGGDGITGLGAFVSTGYPTPNEEPECAASQFVVPPVLPGGPGEPGPGTPGAGVPWSVCELFFLTNFPNHVVCTVALVDDTFGAVGQSGIAYYDLISHGRATWVDRSDIAGRGFAKGCARPDHDDDEHEGDHDKDHDRDDDDDRYDRDRRERWND